MFAGTLLNDAHMRKLPVLKNWIVKQVGHRRWLVQARDLHDWYADPQPDAKLLAQSRLDLSPALASDAIDTPDQGYPAVD